MNTDVVIAGGGLAGLTLARQLKMRMPNINIVVLERGKRPAPEAAYKVGESSVEVAAFYFAQVLGLEQHIDEDQLPKLGLRFFFPAGDNSDLTQRLEIGPRKYPAVPSYQLDRGRFENYLHDLNIENGITVLDKTRVQSFTIGSEGEHHQVKYIREGEVGEIQARWFIDAAGRAHLLKRKLKLQKDAPLNNGAVWFRVDDQIDITDWTDNAQWRSRTDYPKRFSTNHMMGTGYWLWFIPLASGSTSVGLVFDNSIHNFSELCSFDKCMDWLHQNEPQAAEVLETHRDKIQDFLSYKNYAHGCTQVYSGDRWAITGEAGVFIDPFYSPGSDLISYSNDFITEMIVKDMAGENIKELASTYNDIYLKLADVIFTIYSELYPKFGNGLVMTQKILWDSAVYLGVTCLLYFNRKLTDIDFMAKIDNSLGRFNDLLHTVAEHFKNQPNVGGEDLQGEYIDLSQTFLFGRNLNKELLATFDTDEALAAKIEENVQLLERLSKEVFNNVNIGKAFQPGWDEKAGCEEVELA